MNDLLPFPRYWSCNFSKTPIKTWSANKPTQVLKRNMLKDEQNKVPKLKWGDLFGKVDINSCCKLAGLNCEVRVTQS